MAPKGKSTTKKGKEIARPGAGQPATQHHATQPEDHTSFKTLRTCLEPAEAIRSLFKHQTAVARHNERCPDGNTDSASTGTRNATRVHIHDKIPEYTAHGDGPEGAHAEIDFFIFINDDNKESPDAQRYLSQNRDENVKLIEQTYRQLLVAPRQHFITNAWVLTWHKELGQCDILDPLEALGPVRAEWFGRALEATEGDESTLIGTYAWPTCGGCGCYKDKPRCVDLSGPCKVHENEHKETKGREKNGRQWGGNGDLVIEPVDEEVAAWLKMRR